MANRILRDWTDSDKMSSLSVHAERFFTRLIMKVDDYGCFYADTRLLKANLFPLLLDTIREADITRWIAECKTAGLIVLYEVNKKCYVQINDFRQRLDKAKHKYPVPTDNDSVEVVIDFPPETETNPKPKPKKNPETEKVFVRENVSLLPSEIEKLKEKFSEEEIDWMYDKLSNYKLSKGEVYKSDYGAINSWVKDALKKEKSPEKKINNGKPESKLDSIQESADYVLKQRGIDPTNYLRPLGD